MQYNIIFKTIFEYIHRKFRFVHTNRFCKYRKKLRASPRVHLVSININDLITVSNKLHFIMYADDTTIYFNLEDFNQEKLENEVNNELRRVSEWMTLNKLSLNASKTKSMTFHRAQKKVNQLTLKLNGQNIEMVSSFNFLGITLDQNLSWKKHASMVTK